MPNLLRQSTAQTIRFGPFLDDTDFKTAETGLTVAQADRQVSKDGGAFAQSNHTGNSTHDTDGWYSDDLDATDTNTLGILILQVVVTGALPVWHEYLIVPAVVYDTLVSGSDDLNCQVAGMDAGVVTAAAVATGAIDADAIAADAIGSSELATTAVNEIRDAILSDSTAFAGANIDAAVSTRAAASVLGALADAAAAGDPTATDTCVAYLKQIINTLEGSAGIPTFPAEAAPANAVSLAEVIRAIHVDVTGLNGDAMRGTDSASTHSAADVWTSGTRTLTAGTNLNDLSAAEVNAEVLDVLSTDTFAEPTGVPAATTTLATKIGYVYMALRNRLTITSTKKTYFDDSNTAEWEKDLSDDGTTYDESEGNAI